MPSGTLQVYTALAENAAPLPGVTVLVLNEAGTQIARLTTNDVGSAPELVLTAPDEAYSLDEANTTVRPYAVYQLRAEMTGFQTIELEGVQVFAGQQTVARLQFLPAARTLPEVEPETIPEHPLFAGDGGSGPAPIGQCADARVLSEVVVPKKITVHLARPAVSAANVTVSFQDYIANVASSEVYPTWPEQALRANILAQISLALNRIWTEWYPSRGYSFNITNSPGVDQAYVRGRTVFAVMERLTAELFNTYVRRTGDTEPYYTEYCDGKSVTCPGMKQWGTVERAKEGKSALEILRYYYGSRVQLVTTNNIASIPQSYPGSPLRRGSTGTPVRALQYNLRLLAAYYRDVPTVTVDGTFGAATRRAVIAWQEHAGLTVDGVVGRLTWQSIYDSAQQVSASGPAVTVRAPDTPEETLKVGDSGQKIRILSQILEFLAQFLPEITPSGLTDTFDDALETTVRSAQQTLGRTVTGEVTPADWLAFYRAALSLGAVNPASAAPEPQEVWPGAALTLGSSGPAVLQVQQWLNEIAAQDCSASFVPETGEFDTTTQTALEAWQIANNITPLGVVDDSVWKQLKADANIS